MHRNYTIVTERRQLNNNNFKSFKKITFFRKQYSFDLLLYGNYLRDKGTEKRDGLPPKYPDASYSICKTSNKDIFDGII